MRNLLFRWTTMWFVQLKDEKILGAPIMTTLVAIVAFPLGISYGYDSANDIPVFTTTATIILAIIWMVLLFGWVANGVFGKNATLEMRDKYWRTQLTRFKDPNYLFIKLKYPNWQKRERELERKWFMEYQVEFDESEQPFIGKIVPFWFVITALIGFGIGIIIG